LPKKPKKTQIISNIIYYPLYFVIVRKFKSPFSKKAKIFYNFDVFIGGKPDDITVIVSHLTYNEKYFYDSSANTSTTDNNDKSDDMLELI
jgi:hypothetical protein